MSEDQVGVGPLAFQIHPDRDAAIQEAHDRPYLPLTAPATIHHLAFITATQATRLGLYAAVFDLDGVADAHHTMRDDDGLVVRLEPHTEFMSVTLVSQDGPEAGEARLARIAARAPEKAELLVALRVDLLRGRDETSDEAIGGIIRGEVMLTSTCRPGPDGFIVFEVAVPETVSAAQLGRRVQRLLEAETYRTLALIGLAEARRVGPMIDRLEADLAAVTAALTARRESDEVILEKLQQLSARTEAMRAATSYRFAASRAYAALVDERLATLMETKLDQRPTLSNFIGASLAPGVRTVGSTERRQDELSSAIGRALDVLRTRVDVSMDKANQEIMRTMNERQHRQLVLSEAVEGLSVIAISYYLLGLLAYPVRALKEMHLLPVSEYVALGLLAPFVALSVFTIMRRIRTRWDSKSD